MSKDSNNSNSLVTFILQMNVKGDLDESWINRSVDYTYNLNEPKTLRFEWFLSEDKTKATLVEVFGDSNGAKTRVENLIASPLIAEWLERFEPTNFHVIGNINQETRAVLEGFNATFHNYASGFIKNF